MIGFIIHRNIFQYQRNKLAHHLFLAGELAKKNRPDQ